MFILCGYQKPGDGRTFSTLGAISQVAHYPKLGTAILNIYSRTPSTIAMGGITLDILSGNRTLLGLGVSTRPIIEDWHGMDFDKPLARMKEIVALLQLIWRGNPVSFKGNFFNLSNFKLLHSPPRASIPIFLAAVNPLMIALSLSVADGLLLYLRPFSELRSTIQKIRNGITRPFELASVFICSISDKYPDRARKRAGEDACILYFSWSLLQEVDIRLLVSLMRQSYCCRVPMREG